MKNLKKVLAFVVVFAMMLTSAVSAATFPDVADDASYAEAATILSSLGLMIGDDMGNFNPDKILTRAEATALIMRAKGLESASAGAAGATQFTDVAADHWASGYINLAAQSNVVAGYGDGTFGPENEVKYEEFVKMVVAALGYTPKANTLGGYPSGYLIIASQENITKGAAGAAGQPAPRSTVSQLLFNALDVFIMEQTVFVEGEERFEPSETKTLLNTYLGVNKYEGTVTAVKHAAIAADEDTTISIDTTKIDNIAATSAAYDISGLEIGEATNAATLLGYYVTAYVGEDDITGEDVLKAIAAKTGKNETVTVDYSQLTSYENAAAADNADIEKIFYLENETDKVDQELVVDGAAWYYNGNADTTEAVNFIDNGTPGVITFLSNDGMEGYEYVFVTAYGANYLVGEVDAENNMLVDKDNNDIDVIDIESETVAYSFIKDGIAVSYDDIKVGDVLTVAESIDQKFVTVYISDAVVEGTVTEIGSDNGEPTYTIGGEEYKRANAEADAVNMGDEGKFYLNVDGRIAFAEAISTANGNYAYLLAVDATTGIGGDTVEVKFFNTEGEWVITELAQKVNVYTDNGVYEQVQVKDAVTDGEDADFGILTLSADTVNEKVVKTASIVDGNEFFQYELNSTGKISKIYVADTNGTMGDDYFSIYAGDAATEVAYKASTNRLGNIYLTEATKVFYVDTEKAEAADEKAVQIAGIDSLVDDGEYKAVFYDRDINGYAAAVVIYDSNPGIDDAMHPMVLTKVSNGTNEAGLKVKKFYGYQAGEAVEAESVEETELTITGAGEAGLAAGDVILFNLDGEGKISEVKVIMTAAKAKAAALDSSKAIDAEEVADETIHYFGLVSKKASGNIVTIEGTDDVQLRGANLNYYVVNVNRATALVSTGSYSDITASTETTRTGNRAATILFVREYEGEPVIAVAYQMTYTDGVKDAWYGEEAPEATETPAESEGPATE